MEIQTIKLKEGIFLHLLPDAKFKNAVQGVYFSMPLRRETATGLALLPKLLTAGNREYPSRSALHRKLETLYGARLQAQAGKNGEVQVVSLVGDGIADRYAGENVFRQLQAVIETLIFHPMCEGKGFLPLCFAREKETLREEIRSIVNDKRRYALVRCTEEMCKAEPYGVCGEGEEAALDLCTPENTYALYEEMLQKAAVDIFVSGAFSVEQAIGGAQSIAKRLEARVPEKMTAARPLPKAVQYVQDREPVTQGKLVIGYRTDIDPASPDWYALMVYNALFGGGTSSKLFNNVREKMSLCYYASSALERAKGLLLVQAGIEFDKYEITLAAIQKEREALAAGAFSEADFGGAVQGLCNQLRACKDSPMQLTNYLRRQLPIGVLTDPDAAIEAIRTVQPKQIADIATRVHPDTVYFLNGLEGEN